VSLRIANDCLDDYPPSAQEVRPTNHAPVIIRSGQGEVSFDSLRWGFKKWTGKGVIVNARAETLQTKGMFSHLLTAGRCVISAGEYHE